jgi:hypothetical protein
VRIVPTRQIPLRAKTVVQPPGDLFVPTPRQALERVAAREPRPPVPAVVEVAQDADQDKAKPPKVQPDGLRRVAIIAVLLSSLSGVVTIGAFPEPDRAATQGAPSAAADQPFDDTNGGNNNSTDNNSTNNNNGTNNGTGDLGIAVATVQSGTPVSLPGSGSRDWVAPGASPDGALVRADLAEESIEFRAANTQPGLPGAFRLSWSSGTPQDERGDATTMLGVRPSGRVEFVVRPLTSPADLVLHLSGDDVAVTVSTEGDSTRKVLSAAAAVVTVALPAATAATVTVTPAGDEVIGVATAELQ